MTVSHTSNQTDSWPASILRVLMLNCWLLIRHQRYQLKYWLCNLLTSYNCYTWATDITRIAMGELYSAGNNKDKGCNECLFRADVVDGGVEKRSNHSSERKQNFLVRNKWIDLMIKRKHCHYCSMIVTWAKLNQRWQADMSSIRHH